tara:strand:- start:275 stop:421 length:147 start_codon:yes stop_codon:yes gene_type:complete
MKTIESIFRTTVFVIGVAGAVYLLDKFGMIDVLVDAVDFGLKKLKSLK